MEPNVARSLRALAEALPEGSAMPIPREWLLDLLRGYANIRDTADLTIADLSERYGRNASTVRAWVEQGMFPGAYRFQNREWRVPPKALETFEMNERARPSVKRKRRIREVRATLQMVPEKTTALRKTEARPPSTAEQEALDSDVDRHRSWMYGT